MGLSVYKYPLWWDDYTTIELPRGYQILTVQIQQDNLGTPKLWALVDPEQQEKEKCTIKMVGTGEAINENKESLKHINTIQDEGYVWHFFEVVK